MHVLITGSQGFIGIALKAALRARGHEVREMDLRGAGERRGDVTSADDCHAFCRDIDVVIHGAAVHHAVQVRSRPDEVVRVNVGGTDKLLSAAEAARVRRFVYLSTAKVYGEPACLPSRETDPLAPIDPYATAKLAAESRCLAASRATGMELAILRPFSVYGVGQDLDTGYIGMLLAALSHGLDPVLPDFMRDFVYIDDLVEIACACMLQPLAEPTILNVASGRSHRLDALVNDFRTLTVHPINARFKQPSADTIMRSCGDITLANRLFGYTPQVGLRDGLARCRDWALSAKPETLPRSQSS